MTWDTKLLLRKEYAPFSWGARLGRSIAGSALLLTANGWAQEVSAPKPLSGGFDDLVTSLPAALIAGVALIFAIRAHYSARYKQRELERSRKAQATLAAKESIFRAIVENSGAGLWQIDAAGRTLYLNPSMASLLQIEHIDDLAGVKDEALLVKPGGSDIPASQEFTATIVGRLGRQQKVLVSETLAGGDKGESPSVLRSVMVLAQPDESVGRSAAEAGGDVRKPRQATISPITLRPATPMGIQL
jgi:PAS domain-containing protein